MKKDKDKESTKGISKKKSAKKQAEYIRFMFLTIVVGIIICMAVFLAVFSSMNANSHKIKTTTSATTATTTIITTEDKSKYEQTIVAIFQETDLKNKMIKVYSIEREIDITLLAESGAVMKDQYGQVMTLAEFKQGDIVQILYNTRDMKYSSLRIEPMSWTNVSVTGVKIDAEEKLLRWGNKEYYYNSKLVASYGNDFFDIEDLSTGDVVTMTGYKDTVWQISIEKGHGYLKFLNKDKIQDGSIEIGTTIFKALADVTEELVIPEGTYQLVIKGNNIDPFVTEIIITNGQETIVNLDVIETKKGMLVIKANVSDYDIYINGEKKENNTILELDYGIHELTLKKIGYDDISLHVSVYKEVTSVEATMKMKETEGTKFGQIVVNTGTITDASVYVDNVYVGYTPVTLKVAYGQRRVTVKKSGYEDYTLNVVVDEIPKNCIVTLHPKADTDSTTDETGITVTPIY